MKKLKLALVSLAMLACVSTAASAVTYAAADIGFAVPISCGSYEFEQYGEKYTSSAAFVSLAPSISGMALFNDKIGLFANINPFFPVSYSSAIHDKNGKQVGNTSSGSIEGMTSGAKTSMFGMSFLIGPAINIIKNSKNCFTVSPGFHYGFANTTVSAEIMGSTLSKTVTNHYIGLGASIQERLNITSKMHVLFSLEVTIDFVELGKDSNDNYVPTGAAYFNTVPSVGFGVNL